MSVHYVDVPTCPQCKRALPTEPSPPATLSEAIFGWFLGIFLGVPALIIIGGFVVMLWWAGLNWLGIVQTPMPFQ